MGVSIIGGADGPTSIFVTSSVNWAFVIGAAILVGGIIAFFVIKKRRNRAH